MAASEGDLAYITKLPDAGAINSAILGLDTKTSYCLLTSPTRALLIQGIPPDLSFETFSEGRIFSQDAEIRWVCQGKDVSGWLLSERDSGRPEQKLPELEVGATKCEMVLLGVDPVLGKADHTPARYYYREVRLAAALSYPVGSTADPIEKHRIVLYYKEYRSSKTKAVQYLRAYDMGVMPIKEK